jgi:hypothetical protein
MGVDVDPQGVRAVAGARGPGLEVVAGASLGQGRADRVRERPGIREERGEGQLAVRLAMVDAKEARGAARRPGDVPSLVDEDDRGVGVVERAAKLGLLDPRERPAPYRGWLSMAQSVPRTRPAPVASGIPA